MLVFIIDFNKILSRKYSPRSSNVMYFKLILFGRGLNVNLLRPENCFPWFFDACRTVEMHY